ncbi:MAG: DUF4276 family protein [Planctomycetota bacterium]
MTTKHIEILVEEPSMEACLRVLLPRLVGDRVTFDIYPSQCKEELLKNLPDRLRGYASWLPATWRIVVVVDQDADDCQDLKRRLESAAAAAGLTTRSTRPNSWQVVNRIAIEELEAWFFGDVDAVRAVFHRVPRNLEKKRGFRNPDAIRGGTWEAFERVLKKAGYFRSGLPKIQAARKIGQYLDPSRNRSHSFQVFRDAILQTLDS